ncbi:MAG: molybdenum cofactor guanylyltransferase [Candidatus Omnitrophota bacterium]|nr:molybdenum cofactor guanylyltransferase [Candidatus Omnitrophota bacterium]
MKTEIAAGILAGGKNSRMFGRDKSFIGIKGTSIIERTIRLFEEIFGEIILVTNSPGDYKDYAGRVIMVEDEIKDSGPLGGIHAGLSRTSKESVFFVACDMPFLHNDLICRQLDYFNKIECDCLVPKIGNLVEPLHAIYKMKLKGGISDLLKYRNDLSIRSFLKTIRTSYFDLTPSLINQRIFQNLNTPDDLKRLEGSPWK